MGVSFFEVPSLAQPLLQPQLITLIILMPGREFRHVGGHFGACVHMDVLLPRRVFEYRGGQAFWC